MMKKLLAIVLTLVLLTAASAALADEVKIGIIQFAEHASLDNCREGFLQGLAEAGYVEGENLTVLYRNAQADGGMDAQIAQYFVNQNVDLICAIATPSAQAAFNAVLSAKADIPVIYTAVSAPIEAGLADDDGTPVGPVTGTSDLLPVRNQLSMIRELMPEAKTIGLLYTSSETNSEVQAALYEEMAGEFGFEIVSSTVTAGAEVSQAVQALLPQVDCLSMLTDNTVVSYLSVVLAAAEQAGKPVFGSEIEQVALGCAGAEGLDYVALGKQTGEMAARVLNGESAENIPYETIRDSALYLNSDTLETLGIEIPAAMAERGYTDMAE
jgi:putative tryptophan/tyrosine transport system substrate-binding protein